MTRYEAWTRRERVAVLREVIRAVTSAGTLGLCLALREVKHETYLPEGVSPPAEIPPHLAR